MHKETLERVAMSEETSDDPGWRIRREEKEENVKLFIARRFFGPGSPFLQKLPPPNELGAPTATSFAQEEKSLDV